MAGVHVDVSDILFEICAFFNGFYLFLKVQLSSHHLPPATQLTPVESSLVHQDMVLCPRAIKVIYTEMQHDSLV